MDGLVKKLDIANFKALNGWVDRWKIRNSVKFKTVSGEKKIMHTTNDYILEGNSSTNHIIKV